MTDRDALSEQEVDRLRREVAELQEVIRELRATVESLQQQKSDLEIELETMRIHGDAIEAQMIVFNQYLEREVVERKQAEARLQAILERVSLDKADLELILELTTAHDEAVQEQLFAQAEQAIQEATIDGLTQLANRRRFDAYLEQMWAQCLRNRESIALIVCDVDYFKLYNDCYGHQGGDDCLRRIAQAINRVLHRPLDLVARFGGEEFAVVLPKTNLRGARVVIEQLQAEILNLQLPHARSSVSNCVTLSMGAAAIVPTENDSLTQLIETADRALYTAKGLGRNCYVL